MNHHGHKDITKVDEFFLNSNGDPLELGVEGESVKQRDTEEDRVRGVRVVVAMTIVMVMNLPRDSTEGGMLMFAGGGVIQQWPVLLQLMVSSVKP